MISIKADSSTPLNYGEFSLNCLGGRGISLWTIIPCSREKTRIPNIDNIYYLQSPPTLILYEPFSLCHLQLITLSHRPLRDLCSFVFCSTTLKQQPLYGMASDIYPLVYLFLTTTTTTTTTTNIHTRFFLAITRHWICPQ